MVVVEEGVHVYEDPSHSSIDEGGPPPPVVLPGELEVEQGHRDEGRHNDEQGEGEQQDPEEGVDLVAPHAGEDVVQLDVDGREGEEARDDHLEGAGPVPGYLGGDLPGHLGGAGGGAEVVVAVVLGAASRDQAKGDRDAGVKEGEGDDGPEGEGRRGAVGQRDGVDDAEDDPGGEGEERGGEGGAPGPGASAHLEVEVRRGVPPQEGGEAVHHYAGGKDGSPARRRHDAREGHGEDGERGAHELQPGPDRGAEQGRVLGEAEDVPMDELPAALLLLHGLLVELHVPGEVVLEDPHEDDGEEGREEEDQDEGVDDGEPVDLEAPREEAGSVVPGHAVLPHQVLLDDPVDAVGEADLHGLAHVGDVHGRRLDVGDSGADDPPPVRPQLEVLVGVEQRPAPLNLSDEQVLGLDVPHVAPHGHVLNEHLEEV